MPDRVRILETLVAVAIIGHVSIAAGQDLQKRLEAEGAAALAKAARQDSDPLRARSSFIRRISAARSVMITIARWIKAQLPPASAPI